MKMRRKYEVDESYWLVLRFRSFSRRALFALRRTALTFKWGRVPKTWELSFIDRMRQLGRKGIGFNEILRSTLPRIFGEDTSHVLRTWVGRKARNNPERFARTVSKMFGASARNVLGSLYRLADEVKPLENRTPKEPPYQSFLEAIERSDAAIAAAEPNKPRGTTLVSYRFMGVTFPIQGIEGASANDSAKG
jgi:hypothetical protein